MRTLLTIPIAAALAGCCCMTTVTPTDPVLPQGKWQLASIESESARDAVPEGARTPTLHIAADGQVSGVAGINRYSGSVDTATWTQGSFDLGPLAVTRMAGPPEAMQFESRYLAALDATQRFTVGAGALKLVGPDGALLSFEPQSPDP